MADRVLILYSPRVVTMWSWAATETMTSSAAMATMCSSEATAIDILSGDAGRDLLIGSADEDLLSSGNGEDILIGGSTIYDGYNDINSTAGIDAIMAIWTGNGSFTSRMNNLLASQLTAAQCNVRR